MNRGMKRAGVGISGWLMLALAWPTPALAQTTLFASLPAITDSLPDAPSASVPPSPEVVQIAQNRPIPEQSSWLVAPLEAPYRPLAPHEKFQSFVSHTFSPYTFAGTAYDASWAQVWGVPREYDGGMEGWSKRLGAAMAGTGSRSFFGAFLFPTLLHQDPRYFALYQGPVLKRGLHALSRVFVTRRDDGSNTFNSSGMLTIACTESLGMAWAPEGQRSAGKTFTRMLGAMQGEATSYVLREFTPDILRFFRLHAPKVMKRIEERIPAQLTEDMGPR